MNDGQLAWAKLEAEDALKSKIAEKETQIASMKGQIEDLRRRAEQGSHQLQGETQELELESLLRARFPRDVIEPVPNGNRGADVILQVFAGEKVCGTLLLGVQASQRLE